MASCRRPPGAAAEAGSPGLRNGTDVFGLRASVGALGTSCGFRAPRSGAGLLADSFVPPNPPLPWVRSSGRDAAAKAPMMRAAFLGRGRAAAAVLALPLPFDGGAARPMRPLSLLIVMCPCWLSWKAVPRNRRSVAEAGIRIARIVVPQIVGSQN